MENVPNRGRQELGNPAPGSPPQDLDPGSARPARGDTDGSGPCPRNRERGRESYVRFVDLQRRQGREPVRGEGPQKVHRLAPRTAQRYLEAHRAKYVIWIKLRRASEQVGREDLTMR